MKAPPPPGVNIRQTVIWYEPDRDLVCLQVLPLLKTGTQAWQPSDFLPDSSDPDFEDKVRPSHMGQLPLTIVC